MSNEDDNPTIKGCSELIVAFAIGLLVCFVISVCSSCRGTKTITEYVEKPVIVTQEHHTESVKVDIVRDTIKQRDSIYHYIKGDTTIIERWHYLQGSTQIVYRDTSKVRDSIPYPVVTEKIVKQEVEVNRLNWLQKTLIYLGVFSLIFACLWITYRVGKRKLISK